ncbi:glycosyltransferase [Sciscionella sediminilitoris]|uniref:glycosyltransferase n=1 Tax=Sciscionella sediminilitoris TaxID=1445613 RepID=UPI00068A1502|nr:glycosyltransferase [Sciscionella sp. SE31]
MAADTSTTPEQTRAITGQLLVQRGLFRGPAETVPDELYLRVEQGAANRTRNKIGIDTHSHLTGNTYFGRFPASYWQRWTSATEVSVNVTMTGGGRVELWRSDANGERSMVAATAARSEVTLSSPLKTFVDGGALWLEFRTTNEPLTVTDLYWTVAAPERQRLASVVICTYNRVDDCLTTLTALGSDPVALQRLENVYVADQGDDKIDTRERFAEITEPLGDKLRYIQQPNLGGAGGFTRGMYETLGEEGRTGSDVLIMDDDILLDPEIIIRLTAFANCTTSPTLVGGQMLRLLHPSYLFASAEWADMDEFVPGKVKEGGLDDANLLDRGQDLGDRRIDADYNAWWSCLIPSEVIAEIGYAMPFFFQWDDIEYGYRAKKAGFPTVTLPGAGVWHADFDWNDLDDWKRYFSIRNAMVCSALHGRLDPMRTCRVLLAQIVRNLMTMQYGLTATIIKAAEDFLAGPDVLYDGGASAAAEIRALRSEYPDTVKHPVTDIPRVIDQHRPRGYEGRQLGQPPKTKRGITERLLLIRRLTDMITGRKGIVGTIAADESFWWHISQFETAVVTDASQTGVRIRTRDRAQFAALLRSGIRTVRRLHREIPRAKQEWQDAFPKLTSRENWQRLYNR